MNCTAPIPLWKLFTETRTSLNWTGVGLELVYRWTGDYLPLKHSGSNPLHTAFGLHTLSFDPDNI